VTQRIDDAVPATEASASASAMLVSAGAGCFSIGLFYLLGDKSAACNRLLSVYPASGALSGILVLGVVVWILCWAILARRWSSRPPNVTTAVRMAILLLLGSLLLTFPPFVRLL
jgi:hypothetical protein